MPLVAALHNVGRSIWRDQTNVITSPFPTLPTVPAGGPTLLVSVTDSGNSVGVVTDEAPRLFEVRVMPDAQAMPVPVRRTAPSATAMEYPWRRVMDQSPRCTRQ